MREIMDESLRGKLKDSGIKFIRLLWCDNGNVIHAKAAHINFLDDCIKNGIGITVAQQALPAMADVVVPETGLMPVGEVRLMADWSTLTMLPYAEGHAQVLLEALGEDLARSFTAVRQAEWEALKDMSLEDEVNLLVEKY